MSRGVLLLSIIGHLVLLACGSTHAVTKDAEENHQNITEEKSSGVPVVTFDEPLHDFGTVKKGETRTFEFHFTNTGDGPLEIELATACTCTSIDWPRKPILPGERGSIPIVFDSSTKDGEILIDVDLIANTDPIVVTAQFKANVITP